ncbi:hypothetical protein GTZ99_06115 [Novosphingobium sp. FSY-8]|uniref:Parvulin-like PPIase n=1 Tax=Novosphingobium ovatum TaxID=1908523 RepID=A0ABW9XC69_9SPHN|nr:peptidylprolyl isomerase [Novosphingobium ovatum]NBC36131.1 hypothetical protein [Novosphingobium ovatum]
MLQFFRNFFKSTVGIAISLGFIGVLALAFAAGDVSNSLGFSGTGDGSEAVASVGKEKISATALTQQAQQMVEAARKQDPRADMKAFLAQDGLNLVLNDLVDRSAMVQFGKAHGIVAGKRLIDSELTKIPAFQGIDGKFSEDTYRQMLARSGYTDKSLRENLGQDVISRLIFKQAEIGGYMAPGMALRYATLLKEQRSGAIALLPANAFAPKTPATEPEITAWYNTHKANYQLPEHRVIRFARFDASAVKQVPAPTDAEIAARYNAEKAKYAGAELRRIAQVIAINESIAKAIAGDVAKGQTLEAAAKAHGLTVANLGAVTKAQLATQSSTAVAEVAFAAAKGAVAGPAKASLGYAVVRVDAIEMKAERKLESVRGEIVAALTAEKRRTALASLTAHIDEQFGKGGALSDSAKDLGLTITELPPVLADGKLFGGNGQSVPQDVLRIVQSGFSTESEGAAQIIEIVPGQQFAILDAAKIVPATPAPLAAVKQQIAIEIALDKGAKAARAAAMAILAQAKKGTPLATSVAGAGVPLPPLQAVNMSREQLSAQNGQIPPALQLFFGMAQGTTKLMPLPENRGWLVVRLDKVTAGAMAATDPLVGQVGTDLGARVGGEYAQALHRAIRAEVGVQRKDKALAGVAARLSGAAQ